MRWSYGLLTEEWTQTCYNHSGGACHTETHFSIKSCKALEEA